MKHFDALEKLTCDKALTWGMPRGCRVGDREWQGHSGVAGRAQRSGTRHQHAHTVEFLSAGLLAVVWDVVHL